MAGVLGLSFAQKIGGSGSGRDGARTESSLHEIVGRAVIRGLCDGIHDGEDGLTGSFCSRDIRTLSLCCNSPLTMLRIFCCNPSITLASDIAWSQKKSTSTFSISGYLQ